MNTLAQKPCSSPSVSNYSVPIYSKFVRPKSIFFSKTFWGLIFTTTAAVAPIVGESIDAGKLTGNDVANIIVVLCGTGATLMGRIDAGNIYTPHNMPGPNKEEMS